MQEITKAANQTSKTKDRIAWLLLALAAVAVYFFALDIPLLGPDEPRYAQVAREMFLRGDLVTPTLGGANWFEKPALLYWLQIAAYKIFGVSEFAARIGSALFGLLTIFSLWILGRCFTAEDAESAEKNQKLKTEYQRPKTDFANWLALLAASSIGLIVFSRGATFDIILTFPMTASLVCFYIYNLKTSASSASSAVKFLLGFYFFIGVSLLAKGLIGIVFPFAVAAFYFLLSKKIPSRAFLFSLLWGTCFALLVASVWYAPMYRAHGWTFVDEFFIQHHFRRFTSDKYQHHQPFYFFFWVLPLMTLPWLPFFLATIWNFFKGFFHRRDTETQRETLITNHSSLITFALAWLAVPLAFFTFSGSKLPGYILPALPAAIVLTAHSVWRFARASSKRKRGLQLLAFLTFAVVAFSLQFVAPRYARQDSVKSLIEAADANGYGGEKITNLYVVWHNAEFYAANRLIRDADGKTKRYDNFAVLVDDLKGERTPEILVLVAHKDLANVIENSSVESRILDDNGETAIVLVKPKI